MQDIHGYHAHIYFNAQTLDQARALCEAATEKFALQMGRVHQKLVGPHPNRAACGCKLWDFEIGYHSQN
ncbi:hypothetical protein PSCFBP2116_00034 [Pseudomonas syringae]|nr:hypothetical protein PSCFBP2116_00034 [Pseudomonas syringae]